MKAAAVASTATTAIGTRIAPLLQAYAAVLFCSSPRLGAWFALLTFWSPRAALAGVLGLVAAAGWARLLALSAPGAPHLINSLLCGLFLGAFHALDAILAGWIIAAALLITLCAHWLSGLLWRVGKLPLLSLPFVLGVWLIQLATQSSPDAAMMAAPLSGNAGTVFWPWADGFFTALGWLLLVPYPLAGALIFAGLAVASRYLALLALGGYLAGQGALLLFGRPESMLIGFNFMLATMALGGIFAIPGHASLIVALAGGALAGWMSVALASSLQGLHLPLLTLPFILTVYLWLGALSSRTKLAAPILLLDAPSAPETSWERARLAKARGVGGDALHSLPLSLPYFGEWRVTQGFNGHHTHRDAWQHALDFEIFDGDCKTSGTGAAREDYFCFGAPLLAPVAGQVIAAVGELPDVAPGEADVTNNWGNHVLLRTAGGAHVLLAHLRQGSLLVQSGVWVAAGQTIAACGSSGRSPVPHLHLQAQAGSTLGSPTMPFHLSNVLLQLPGGKQEFRLCHQPQEGDRLAAAPRDERLAQAASLPPGMRWRYRMDDGEVSELRSELTLLGQSRLNAGEEASVAYEETPTAIGYFDRQGERNALLDLWVLALGLSPLSSAAETWSDRPSTRLLPLGPFRRALLACLYPLGAACHSSYRRDWDESANAWCQNGKHRICVLPGLTWHACTQAWIRPNQGVIQLKLDLFSHQSSATLESCESADEHSSPVRRTS